MRAGREQEHRVDLIGGISIAQRSRRRDPPILRHAERIANGDYRDVEGPFDFVISSLVTHHMRDGELTDFIGFMEVQSTRGWLISDLHRHRIAYRLFPILARLLHVHPIVREDGLLSIARSFRADEWREILAAAACRRRSAHRPRMPFRLCVERLR